MNKGIVLFSALALIVVCVWLLGLKKEPGPSLNNPPFAEQSTPAERVSERAAKTNEALKASNLSPGVQQGGTNIDVRALINLPEEAFTIFPPIRRDCVVVHLREASRLTAEVREKGRVIENRYLLLPLAAAEQNADALHSGDVMLPVFGEGDDQLFLTERINVRFRDPKTSEEIDRMAGMVGATSRKNLLGPENLYSFAFPEEMIEATFAIAWKLSSLPDVLYAEPNWLGLIKPATADPFYGQQWALENTGQALPDPVPGIVPDADLDVPEAWSVTHGRSNIWIAVLDDGVEWDHPDLVSAMAPSHTWFDFADNDSDPRPLSVDAHGTSIAGILAALPNNGLGVSGVAPGCRVLPIRIAYSSGSQWVMNVEWAVNGIGWAWQHGASVLNLSWGGGTQITALRDALLTAVTSGRSGKGCVVAVSAGNGNGVVSSFPANMPELLTVGASSPADERKSPTSVDGEILWGSDYGEPLDCMAPGVKIYTTDHTGVSGKSADDYNSRFNGTSAAAPFAAGVAALVLSADDSLSQGQVTRLMTLSAERVGRYGYGVLKTNGVWDAEMGYGRLNAHRAVSMAQGFDYELPRIVHTPLPGQTNTGPFTLTADISDTTGIAAGAHAPRLYYSTGGVWTNVTDADGPSGSTYSFQIPYIASGSTATYYFAAQDISPQQNTLTLPFGGSGFSPPGSSRPSTLFTFVVDPNAGVITVNDNGAAHYSSIQAAMNAARYGDTIKVAGGTYRENISMSAKSGLKIMGGYSEDFKTRGADGPPSIIDGQNLKTVVSLFDCNDMTLDGFVLINGNASYVFGLARWAGGFIVKGGQGMLLSHLVVSNCTAYCGGGGVLFQTAACRLEKSRLTRNNAECSGSALCIRECSPIISYCDFVNNRSKTGRKEAAAVGYYEGYGSLQNVTIAKNTKDATYGFAGCDFFSAAFYKYPALTNVILRYNYHSAGFTEFNASTILPRKNCLFSLEAGDNLLKFFDTEAGRFNLKAGSTGIDGGVNWGATQDIDGLSVAYGAAPDIGAHEFRPDIDEDGVQDVDELNVYHTSPFKADSDGDEIPDGWELKYASNPLVKNALVDVDNDRFNALAEYIAGTVPTNAASYFKVETCCATTNGTGLTIGWQSVSGRQYTVYSASDLGAHSWVATSFKNIIGTNGPLLYTGLAPNTNRCFYKVDVQLIK